MYSVFKEFRKSLTSSISKKILAAILIVSSIVTTIVTVIQVAYDYNQEVRSLENDIRIIEKSYHRGIQQSLWDFNLIQLQINLDGIIYVPGLEYVRVINQNGEFIAEAGRKVSENVILRTIPIVQDGPTGPIQLGILSITAGLDPIFQKLYDKILFIFFTQLIKTLLISTVIYLVIQRILTRHLVHISNYMQSFSLGSSSSELSLNRPAETDQLSGNDELDILVKNINALKAKLNRTYQELYELNQDLERKVDEKTAQLIKQRQKLEYSEKMTTLGEMAGGIAHEINTPLSIIAMHIESLQRSIEQPEIPLQSIQKSLNTCQRTVLRIAKIIQGLRNFSRDGAQDPMQEESLKKIIDDTISLCQEKLKNLGVHLEGPGIPEEITVFCRPVELSQVFLNLIANATNAIQEQPEKWIRIDWKVLDGEVQVSVTDSGAGIPRNLQDKIFQPFFTTREVGQGTGLGLSISKGIIEGHRGRLFLDKNSEHTRFVVTLPRVHKQAFRPLPEMTV